MSYIINLFFCNRGRRSNKQIDEEANLNDMVYSEENEVYESKNYTSAKSAVDHETSGAKATSTYQQPSQAVSDSQINLHAKPTYKSEKKAGSPKEKQNLLEASSTIPSVEESKANAQEDDKAKKEAEAKAKKEAEEKAKKRSS
mmetsp:Transcript_11756/g.17442  ORF Transcript_11756/g.17442 Transcript_11756/m.17442 type:complete len:143 (+) Transcript_11756:93-521(+)